MKANNCIKEKKMFNTNLKNMLIFFSIILLIYAAYLYTNKNTQKVLDAFLNHQELICHTKIVSLNKGYAIDKNDKYTITDGENIFLLRQCIIKE